MLAAEGTAELKDQVTYLLGDGHHSIDAVRLLDVDKGANVQATNAGVPVVPRLRAMGLYDLIEPLDELWQLLRRDGGIFNKSQRLSIARDIHHQA